MHVMHLRGVDLNLAVVLQVLLDERNVSRAAERLGLSQSATSHALARLRDLLDDPILVRASSGLVPTARAEVMRESLAAGLAALEHAFTFRQTFDPREVRLTFKLGTSDYAELVVMPALLSRLAEAAPHLGLWMAPSPLDPLAALGEGAVDLLFAPTVEGVPGLYAQPLWTDHFVCVARRGHPLTRGTLTPERFAAAEHAFVAPRGRPGGVVDDALAARGLRRRIAFTTPSFLVAPQVVAGSDLVITLAARVAHAFAKTLPLTLFAPPFELPDFQVAMYWHERRHADPAHRFLRAEVLGVASTLPKVPALRARRR